MQHFVFVRKNNRYEKIKFSELLFVKAMRGYMQLVTENHIYFVLNTIEEVEKHLPKELFCRVHRGYIVAIERIQSFDNWKVVLTGSPDVIEYVADLARLKELPVGRRFRRNLIKSINILPNRMNARTKRIIKDKEFLMECAMEDKASLPSEGGFLES